MELIRTFQNKDQDQKNFPTLLKIGKVKNKLTKGQLWSLFRFSREYFDKINIIFDTIDSIPKLAALNFKNIKAAKSAAKTFDLEAACRFFSVCKDQITFKVETARIFLIHFDTRIREAACGFE